MRSRRVALALLGAGLALAIAAGTAARAPIAVRADEGAAKPFPGPAPVADVFGREQAEHLLNRAGFGGTPEEVDRLVALGREGAVRALFEPLGGEEYAALPEFETIVDGYPTRAELAGLTPEERKARIDEVQKQDRRQGEMFRVWWIDRMVSSPAPLEEKMTLFWHGYFTSSIRDVKESRMMIRQNELLRKHALGSFRRLLHSVSRDPAMLRYLNNNQNRKDRPNENFAREVMELFTLGLGNYTEKDIKEAARAFTGWTVRDAEFVVQRKQHDDGVKTVLGKTGNFDGGDILDILLAHEAAPRHVATRLLDHFVGPTIPKGMVERYAKLLRAHDWEMRPVLEALFKDPDFYRPEVVGNKILGPVEFLVGISRRMGEAPPGELLVSGSTILGQSLLDPPNVKGWEEGEAWITTATFLQRGNIAGYLVQGVDPRRIRDDFMRDDPPAMPGPDGPGMQEMPGAPGEGTPPAAPGAKPGKGQGQGQGKLGAGAMLAGLRGVRWKPTTRLREQVKAAGVKSAQEVVDHLCDRFLAVRVTDEARASLLAFLADPTTEPQPPADPGKKGKGKGKGSSPEAPEDPPAAGETTKYRIPTETKLRKLVHLILSLPEAQIG
jgi:uncharacterized protein (DUF1800 family)